MDCCNRYCPVFINDKTGKDGKDGERGPPGPSYSIYDYTGNISNLDKYKIDYGMSPYDHYIPSLYTLRSRDDNNNTFLSSISLSVLRNSKISTVNIIIASGKNIPSGELNAITEPLSFRIVLGIGKTPLEADLNSEITKNFYNITIEPDKKDPETPIFKQLFYNTNINVQKGNLILVGLSVIKGQIPKSLYPKLFANIRLELKTI